MIDNRGGTDLNVGLESAISCLTVTREMSQHTRGSCTMYWSIHSDRKTSPLHNRFREKRLPVIASWFQRGRQQKRSEKDSLQTLKIDKPHV